MLARPGFWCFPLVGEGVLVSAAPQPLASGGAGSGSTFSGTSGSIAAGPGLGLLFSSQSGDLHAARGPFIRTTLRSRGMGVFPPEFGHLAAVVEFLYFLFSDQILTLSSICSYVSAIRCPLQLARATTSLTIRAMSSS